MRYLTWAVVLSCSALVGYVAWSFWTYGKLSGGGETVWVLLGLTVVLNISRSILKVHRLRQREGERTP